MDTQMHLEPIGSVSSPRSDASNTTGWGDVVARIDLDDALGARALDGLGAR